MQASPGVERNMSVAGSNDVLTSAALFFARNKLAGQAELLVCRYNKYKAVLEAALPKLVARVQELLPAALSPEQHADVVHQLHKELQQLAMEWRDEANKRHGGRQHDSILHHFAAAVRQRDALHAQQLTNHDIVSRGDRAELAAARVIAAVADPQLAQVYEATTAMMKKVAEASRWVCARSPAACVCAHPASASCVRVSCVRVLHDCVQCGCTAGRGPAGRRLPARTEEEHLSAAGWHGGNVARAEEAGGQA